MILSGYDSERFPFHIPNDEEAFNLLLECDQHESSQQSLLRMLNKVSGSIAAVERGKSLILADTSDPENNDGGEYLKENECGIILRTQHETVTPSLYLLIVEISLNQDVSFVSLKTLERGLEVL